MNCGKTVDHCGWQMRKEKCFRLHYRVKFEVRHLTEIFFIFFCVYLSSQGLKHNDTNETVIQTNKICLFLIVFILCKCDLTWSKVSNHILWLGNIFILLSFKNESETRRLQNKIGGANSFNRREKFPNTFKEWKRRNKMKYNQQKTKRKNRTSK